MTCIHLIRHQRLHIYYARTHHSLQKDSNLIQFPHTTLTTDIIHPSNREKMNYDKILSLVWSNEYY